MSSRFLAVLIVMVSAGAAIGESCAELTAQSITPDQIDNCRPLPAGAAHLSRALAALPPKGELTRFNQAERAKLESLNEFVRRIGRDGAWVIKVVDAPQAAIGLFERAVVIVTGPAFHRLSSLELQAVIAHEFGHEYVWREFEAARLANNHRRLQELELVCDRVAVVLLERFQIDTRHLRSALQRIEEYNLERFVPAANTPNYPSLQTRTDLINRWSRPRRR